VINGMTGTLVADLSTEAFADAVARTIDGTFDARAIRAHAEGFSRQRFGGQIAALIDQMSC
jgi:glycosyltransferase involved in cell wall biosynthesis